MTLASLAEYALFTLIVLALVRPVGGYLTLVFAGRRTFLDPALRPLEQAIYRLSGVDPEHEMDWRKYAASFVLFGVAGTAVLLLSLVLQTLAPWNNDAYLSTPMTIDLAFNTAVSFVTTTWQAYGGETTISYISQMVGLAAQNFLAGAAGLAVGIAFVRGLAREGTTDLGNFWVDLVRALLWVLLPVSLLGGLVLVWQGVPMNWSPYATARTLEGAGQTIAQGPVAALEFIENLGTNGGGFILVPALLLYPREQPTAITTISLAVVCCNALSGTAAYVRLGRVDYRTGTAFAVATIPGAVAGVFATGLFRRGPFDLLLGVLLVALAVWLVVRPAVDSGAGAASSAGLAQRAPVDATGTRYSYAYNQHLGLAISALVGFLSSLLGIGDGIIHVPAMVQSLHIPAHVATATSHFVLSFTSLSRSAVHALCGDFAGTGGRVPPLAIGVIAGVQVGAALSERSGGTLIVRLLALALALVGVRLVIGAL